VKSSAEVKPIHLDDLAFQQYCCSTAGLKVRNCKVAYVNRNYVLEDRIDPESLFIIEDVTEPVAASGFELPERVDEMLSILRSGCPESSIGPHCNDPYDCPLFDIECGIEIEEGSVLELHRGGLKKWQLYRDNISRLADIPMRTQLSPTQRLQRECAISDQPYINKQEITRFLEQIEYPVQYLDFETLNLAIPIFIGTHPYQHIPFQFSLHTIKSDSAEPEHVGFLIEGTGDPRARLIKELKRALKPEGSIVVYNKSFEVRILKELAQAFPSESRWLGEAISRIVDLHEPFRTFSYYHPSQCGSTSIKRILPVLTDSSYERMEIAEGEIASIRFQEVTYGDVSPGERRKVRNQLEEYCQQDTQAMVDIKDKLTMLAFNAM
jgi:hypothetical protein